MRSSAAARRYARALFSLAKEDGRTGDVRREIDVLTELFAGSAELREALLTPLHPVKERRAVLRAISERAGLSQLIRNFYSYLIEQRRLVDFPGISAEFARLVDEDSGVMTAEVVAAAPLDEGHRDRLRLALSARTGYDVRLQIEIDPDLIGGAIAKVGDLIFDGCIRTQLEQLRSNLTRGS
jgi:F-type H+-transporting ATPase subunit delta